MIDPRKINLLVIEDDADLRDSIVDALCGIGFSVQAIESAEDLPADASLLHTDIVILDLNLPGEDGISLAKRLQILHPALGIIMLSARNLSDQRREGYSSGADIYLSKPSSINEIEQAIYALLRRVKSENNLLPQSTLALNLKSLMLYKNESNIALTQNEAALLIAFCRANSNTLEIWQIAELLQFDLDTLQKSLVELHVSRLRNKLVVCGETRQSIRALRGIGYQLCIEILLVG